MSRYVVLLPCILALITANCAVKNTPTLREQLNSWIGFHIAAVIQEYGAYSQVVSDGKDGHIYVWIDPGRYIPPGPALPYPKGGGFISGFTYGLNNTLRHARTIEAGKTKRTEFFVRADGIVYSWRAVR